MDQLVARLNINIITLTLMIAMLAAGALARWIGYKRRLKGLTKPSKFDDASMALLGLLLAFTFGMSIQRHDQRWLAVVAPCGYRSSGCADRCIDGGSAASRILLTA